MKLQILFVGKSSEVDAWEQKYAKRLRMSHEFDWQVINPSGLDDQTKGKKLEAEKILARLKPTDQVIALDEGGKAMDSLAFADWLGDLEGGVRLVLIIGGAYGLDTSVLDRAHLNLSLGKMVWTRELARLMTIEQLYRGFEILRGSGFHKI